MMEENVHVDGMRMEGWGLYTSDCVAGKLTRIMVEGRGRGLCGSLVKLPAQMEIWICREGGGGEKC